MSCLTGSAPGRGNGEGGDRVAGGGRWSEEEGLAVKELDSDGRIGERDDPRRRQVRHHAACANPRQRSSDFGSLPFISFHYIRTRRSYCSQSRGGYHLC